MHQLVRTDLIRLISANLNLLGPFLWQKTFRKIQTIETMKNSLDQLESRYVDLNHMHERAESLEHHAEDFAKQVHTEGYQNAH